MTVTQTALQQFAKDVDLGLSATQKNLPSRYIYNKEGDALFQSIMAMPEYYLTRCEHEIFLHQADDLIDCIEFNKNGFDLVELGAGDGYKTRLLINALLKRNINFTYKPIDISANALELIEQNLQDEFPDLIIKPKQGEYFEVLEQLKQLNKRPKLILFMGSNIGNLINERLKQFICGLGNSLNTNDRLVVGFDLKKDPSIIKQAYNDPHGFTKAFNLNILKRINEELGGNFNLDQFSHEPFYNPETGLAASYLVSRCKQDVYIEALNKSFSFKAWESIHTEVSQKYDKESIASIAALAGLKVMQMFTDEADYFAEVVLTKS